MRYLLPLLLLPAVALAAPVPKQTEKEKIESKFGKIVDPKGDSKFALDGDKLVVTLPANESRSFGFKDDPDHPNDRTKFEKFNHCPQVEFEAEGDCVITVRVTCPLDPAAGDAADGKGVFGFVGGGILARTKKGDWKSVGICRFTRLDHVPDSKGIVPATRAFLNADGPEYRNSNGYNIPTLGSSYVCLKPIYLRGVRREGEWTISSSDDGKEWKEVDWWPDLTEAPVKFALYAQHSTDKDHTVTFDEFKVEPIKKK